MQYNEDEVNGYSIDENGVKTYSHWNNHLINDNDINQLKDWLDLLKDILNIDTAKSGATEEEIKETEKRLGIEIPQALKLIYSYIGKDERHLKSVLENISFLSLDKLYIDENNLVYKTQGTKYAWGIDLEKLRLNYWAKDYGWYWSEDTMSFWEQSFVDISCFAINHMQTVMYSRLKGFNSLKPSREAEERYNKYLTRMPDFDYYDHTIFYNKKHKALAWFRGGQFNQDILIGCDDKNFIDDFAKTFDLTKANYKIIDGQKVKKTK